MHDSTMSADSQPDLFSQPEPGVEPSNVNLTLPERFEAFHAANDHVYATLVKLARRFIDATGRRRLSVQRLFEIARWDLQIATRGKEEFEINNSFVPYYARLIMLRETDLDGVFETRAAAEPDRWIAMVRHDLRRTA